MASFITNVLIMQKKSSQQQVRIIGGLWKRTPLTVVHGYLDMLDPEDFPDSGPMLIEMRKQSPSPLSPSVSYLVVDEAWQGLGQSADEREGDREVPGPRGPR